jgi:Asp-tRNA(Asn)/Glu-tRNA(Gln) amidotransferase A subunit family amidase
MHQDFRNLVENSYKITPAQLVAAYDLAAECRRAFDGLFGASLDVVLTPASPGEPPEGLQSTGDPVFNSMWTLLHVPCVGIPVGASPKSLPLGIQLVGPRCSDAQLLAIAQACAPAIDQLANGAPIQAEVPHAALA